MTKTCVKDCLKSDNCCENRECRNWMDYSDDLNCAVVAAEAHGPMTLAQIGDRLGMSLVRVMQIEEKALVKMKKRMQKVLHE